MNTEIINPLGSPSLQSRTILNEERMTGALVLIEAGQEIAPSEGFATDEHILFVVEGRITVRIGELFHVLNKDQALHIAAGQRATLWNDTPTWAKVLRIDVRVPAPAEPLLVELPRS